MIKLLFSPSMLSKIGFSSIFFLMLNLDAITAVLLSSKSSISSWNVLYKIDDQTAAKKIYNENINVLIDLSGHTANNRLSIFAWKPAPVQISWLGYFATTGLTEMDYIIGSYFI